MGALAAPLIQAGASLLGGLLGKGPPKPSAMVVSHIKGVMDASKRFGMNPLTILGAVGGPTQGAAPQNHMGAALADAAMFAADAFLKEGNEQALLVNQYQEQNRQLRERLTHVTLNPKVPGIYGGGDGAARAGVTDGLARPVPSGPAGRPLDDVDKGFFADPRRPVDQRPVTSHPGYMRIDNPNVGIPLRVPTLDGDEPLHWYDYPDLALTGAIAAKDFVGALSDEDYRTPGKWGSGSGVKAMSYAWRKATKPKKTKKHDLHALGF